MTTVALWVLVFLAAATLDFAMVKYQRAVKDELEHTAGRWSVGVYLVGVIGTLSVVDVSKWFIIPECLGLYAGTWAAVRPGTLLAVARFVPAAILGAAWRIVRTSARWLRRDGSTTDGSSSTPR